MQIPRQPSCRLTGGSTIAKKKCQRHPLRILRPVATLAVSMTLFNDNENLAIQVAETKKPHQPNSVRFNCFEFN